MVSKLPAKQHTPHPTPSLTIPAFCKKTTIVFFKTLATFTLIAPVLYGFHKLLISAEPPKIQGKPIPLILRVLIAATGVFPFLIGTAELWSPSPAPQPSTPPIQPFSFDSASKEPIKTLEHPLPAPQRVEETPANPPVRTPPSAPTGEDTAPRPPVTPPQQNIANEETDRLAAEQEAQRKLKEETDRLAAEQETQRKLKEETDRLAAEQETQRKLKEETDRLAAEQETQRKLKEETDRLAAEQEAQRKLKEETDRLAAEQETQRKLKEETDRLAAEQEAQRKLKEEADRLAAAQAAAQRSPTPPPVVVTPPPVAHTPTPPPAAPWASFVDGFKLLTLSAAPQHPLAAFQDHFSKIDPLWLKESSFKQELLQAFDLHAHKDLLLEKPAHLDFLWDSLTQDELLELLSKVDSFKLESYLNELIQKDKNKFETLLISTKALTLLGLPILLAFDIKTVLDVKKSNIWKNDTAIQLAIVSLLPSRISPPAKLKPFDWTYILDSFAPHLEPEALILFIQERLHDPESASLNEILVTKHLHHPLFQPLFQDPSSLGVKFFECLCGRNPSKIGGSISTPTQTILGILSHYSDSSLVQIFKKDKFQFHNLLFILSRGIAEGVQSSDLISLINRIRDTLQDQLIAFTEEYGWFHLTPLLLAPSSTSRLKLPPTFRPLQVYKHSFILAKPPFLSLDGCLKELKNLIDSPKIDASLKPLLQNSFRTLLSQGQLLICILQGSALGAAGWKNYTEVKELLIDPKNLEDVKWFKKAQGFFINGKKFTEPFYVTRLKAALFIFGIIKPEVAPISYENLVKFVDTFPKDHDEARKFLGEKTFPNGCYLEELLFRSLSFAALDASVKSFSPQPLKMNQLDAFRIAANREVGELFKKPPHEFENARQALIDKIKKGLELAKQTIDAYKTFSSSEFDGLLGQDNSRKFGLANFILPENPEFFAVLSALETLHLPIAAFEESTIVKQTKIWKFFLHPDAPVKNFLTILTNAKKLKEYAPSKDALDVLTSLFYHYKVSQKSGLSLSYQEVDAIQTHLEPYKRLLNEVDPQKDSLYFKTDNGVKTLYVTKGTSNTSVAWNTIDLDELEQVLRVNFNRIDDCSTTLSGVFKGLSFIPKGELSGLLQTYSSFKSSPLTRAPEILDLCRGGPQVIAPPAPVAVPAPVVVLSPPPTTPAAPASAGNAIDDLD